MASSAGWHGRGDRDNWVNVCWMILQVAANIEQRVLRLGNVLVRIAYVFAERVPRCCPVCAHLCCFQEGPKLLINFTEFRQCFPHVLAHKLYCLMRIWSNILAMFVVRRENVVFKRSVIVYCHSYKNGHFIVNAV